MENPPKESFITSEPLVSIIMLTYNRVQYLEKAIKSVISQTYTNWELIIIDDGSTDTTAALVKNIEESRVRYIKHENNAGLHARRKESLSYPKGSYVAVLDSDDFWISSTKLQEQVDWLEEHIDCVLVGTFASLVDTEGTAFGTAKYETGDVTIRNKILQRNQFTHSAVMIRRDALQQTKGYQPILAEDLELFLQLGKLGTFANIPAPMTAHRVHEQSENDHGIKMCSAVHKIIARHQTYPHYKKARSLSYTRLLYCHLKALVKRGLSRQHS